MNTLQNINIDGLIKSRTYTPSPESWADQVLYFLIADRFSNGAESEPYNPDSDYENAIKDGTSGSDWNNAGGKWLGGTINGIKSRLDYLKELGITAIWISPVFKQVPFEDTYHGYGIQNFLEIDPHFGKPEDLEQLVDEAHRLGMFVILDIIVNHSGNVFRYAGGDMQYNGSVFDIAGFNDREGNPVIPAGNRTQGEIDSDSGIWPKELMTAGTFTRKGRIVNWDKHPEYIEGDFFSLKNIHTGTGDVDTFEPSAALKTITECYKYWIAYADIDGFRLDTVKHLYPGATRYFVREIHEFAETIGKSNFYVIGEITGGLNFAVDTQRQTGIDAALGINKIPETLENAAKGYIDAHDFFDLFKNSDLTGEDEYKWYKDNVITMFDDHDMVTQQAAKSRFCADRKTAPLLLNAMAMNLLSPGIPCIYYGTEQGFDGSGDDDKYIREAMFGGDFGAFRSKGKHFFNSRNRLYKGISDLIKTRKDDPCLRQGRAYLRPLSYDGSTYELPHRLGPERYSGVIAWSRILSTVETVIAVNCDLDKSRSVNVSVDASLHTAGEDFVCIYSSQASADPVTVPVIETGRMKSILIDVPKCGCIIFQKK